MTILRLLLLTLTSLTLCACSSQPQEANPAIWRIEDREGNVGWLFGTIHSAETPLLWRTPPVAEALDNSGEIMVEVANLAQESDVAATFARLAKATNQPPLSRRVEAEDRAALATLLKKSGYEDDDFAAMDTWAAALTLARGSADAQDARNGVDRAVIAAAGERPVVELEGAQAQLRLFDTLPEHEQRDLLAGVVAEASAARTDIAEAWRTGDMDAITEETRSGLLADPELREVLFVGRNRDWSAKIIAALNAGRRPFVAVGAAHMAGPDGLPAMLQEAGVKVQRLH